MFYFVLVVNELVKSPVELSLGDDSTNYLNIMSILQAKVPSPDEYLSENDNENDFNEHREAAELDDFLTYDISDDILHYDINKIKKSP